MHTVSLRNIGKTHRLGALSVAALSDVSLDIYPDRFTVLSGPSGSGKTTLLNLIGCIDRPSQGRLSVAGQDVATLSDDALADFRARHIGFVFQNFNLLPVLSAFENVEYPLLLARVPRAARRARVEELLAAVGLSDKHACVPGQLSGGQRQRVAIARALATRPALVLADEPTANLDSQTGAAIIALMRSMQQQYQVSFIFSSHDPQVLAAADDAILIRDGRLVSAQRNRMEARMKTLSLALRNLARNRRRSLTTVLAMIVGAVSILLFGGYSSNIKYGLQTGLVQNGGHLQLQRKNYFLYGGGNPAAYGIVDYAAVIGIVAADPRLAPLLEMSTPSLNLGGIAGNFGKGVSRTVIANGAVVGDLNRMRQWNEYGFPWTPKLSELTGTAADAVIVGTGVARVLQLCAELKVANCPAPGRAEAQGAAAPADIAALAGAEPAAAAQAGNRIEMLAANSHGAPNVAALHVVRAVGLGEKGLDDMFVGMHLAQAQKLVYGSGPAGATAIALQLRHTADMPAARARLLELLDGPLKRFDLEVQDFDTLNPSYGQIVGMFAGIFSFISLLIGAIVLFTVGNTMSMAVIERTTEIGTLRAMGLRRAGIRRLFLGEGLLLGLIGALLGVAFALSGAWLVNHAGLSWTPPGNVDPVPLTVRVWGESRMIVGTSIGLVLVSMCSAWLPAHRASGMNIVDALRHV